MLIWIPKDSPFAFEFCQRWQKYINEGLADYRIDTDYYFDGWQKATIQASRIKDIHYLSRAIEIHARTIGEAENVLRMYGYKME